MIGKVGKLKTCGGCGWCTAMVSTNLAGSQRKRTQVCHITVHFPGFDSCPYGVLAPSGIWYLVFAVVLRLYTMDLRKNDTKFKKER